MKIQPCWVEFFFLENVSLWASSDSGKHSTLKLVARKSELNKRIRLKWRTNIDNATPWFSCSKFYSSSSDFVVMFIWPLRIRIWNLLLPIFKNNADETTSWSFFRKKLFNCLFLFNLNMWLTFPEFEFVRMLGRDSGNLLIKQQIVCRCNCNC